MKFSVLLVAVISVRVHNHSKLNHLTYEKSAMLKKLLLIALLSGLPLGMVNAQEDQLNPEPEITITHDGEATYYEYRVGGILKEIKVVPVVGEPYYLVPQGESGELIRAGEPTVLTPKWVLFSW
jgi:hypothetical protein